MGDSVAIHANFALTHQREYGKALAAGFRRHGIEAQLTDDRYREADTHVVIGPWFAFTRWRYANTLYLDRAYWDDPKAVSIHWLRNGEKYRPHHTEKRPHPGYLPYKRGNRSIYLCDYGMGPTVHCDTVRRHPANGERGDLREALEAHDIARGRRTTALVDAARLGLVVETDDPHSPVWAIRGGLERADWMNNLAWHNWTLEEIRNGDFWDGFGNDNGAD